MKKIYMIFVSLIFLLTMSGIALAIDNLTVTLRVPQGSEILTGTRILNTTTNIASQNCSFYRGSTAATATTLIGTVFNYTDTGTTNTVFNLSLDTSTITDGVYAINVTCYNETLDAANDMNATNGTTGVIIDNTAPTVTLSLSAASVRKRGGNTATCSALGGQTSISNYSQVVLKPNGDTAGTSTSSTYNMDGTEFQEVGVYTMYCSATEQTNLTTRTATQSITVLSQSTGLTTMPEIQQAQTIQQQAAFGSGFVGQVQMAISGFFGWVMRTPMAGILIVLAIVGLFLWEKNNNK